MSLLVIPTKRNFPKTRRRIVRAFGSLESYERIRALLRGIRDGVGITFAKSETKPLLIEDLSPVYHETIVYEDKAVRLRKEFEDVL